MGIPLNIGRTLRELRKSQGMTGTVLADKTGLSQSKISKIETGANPHILLEDAEKILNILDTPETIRQQILRQIDDGPNRNMKFRPLHISHAFGRSYELERNASQVCVFTYNVLPALLQTLEYRKSLLENYNLIPEKIAEIMSTSLKRQELLWRKDCRFHFVLPEAALYTRLAGVSMQHIQLDRLCQFSGLANIKIGIIPLEAGLCPAENGNFAIYDSRALIMCVGTGEIESNDFKDLNQHQRIFAELAQIASYGDNALSLIRKASEHF
jgi:transcriptional regulator with XRE-family HTH domain